MTVYIGIDPGLPLTIGLLDEHGRNPRIVEGEALGVQVRKAGRKTPTWDNSPALLASALRRIAEGHDIPFVAIETATLRKGEGIATGGRFVGSYWLAVGVCAALDLPWIGVAAVRWKKFHGIIKSEEAQDSKELSRQAAIRAWPEAAHLFKRKMDHNRADALLLALWGLHTARSQTRRAS